MPLIWNAVRHAVDRHHGTRGLWILAGSSTPLSKDSQTRQALHSGAGRIGRIRMRPMSLAESGDSTAAVSLKALFAGNFRRAKVEDSAAELVRLACRGGWPEVLSLTPEQAQLTARGYLDLLFGESVPQHGKSAQTARSIALSLARNLGQAATYKTILCDIYGEEAPLITAATLASYLELLKVFSSSRKC